jgi:alpha-L-fucosidase 2
MDELKRLIQDGRYVEAETLAKKEFLAQRGGLSNRPLCKLKLELHTDQETDTYRRLLDMERGIATVEYKKNGAAFRREQFVSHPDQVWVLRQTSDAETGISFNLTVLGFTELDFQTVEDTLFLTGKTEEGGTAFTAGIRVVAEQGKVKIENGCIRVDGADTAVVLMTVGTDYYGDDPMQVCRKRLDAVRNKPYAEIRQDHVADHQALYNRVDLKLGEIPELGKRSTGERVAAMENGADDSFLASQFYQMGRYLIIASSRPGDMPAHLHGLWIKDFAPKYNCAYHLNVNIQMNYWPAEVGNLSELHVPFFDFIDALRENGRTTAREVYNCGGFVVHHNVDGSLETGPFGEVQWGFWPMGHVWACQNLWEHYLFSGDKVFLREKGYPILKEAAEFVHDYLMENPDTGKLIFGPSTSPENFYETVDGKKARIMTGIAMDQQLTWDLFTHCIQSAKDLGIKDAFTDQLVQALEKLEPTQIGDDGRVLEWRRPLKEASPEHRHVSHLFGAYPGHQFTPEREPELYRASIQSLEARISAREGLNFKGPAWAKAYSVLLWARFQRPNDAYAAYKRLFEYNHISENLFAAFTKERVIMDANGGGAAGIAEMLIQSHRGFIELLPALPSVWNDGSFRGLKARGGFEIDLAWSGGAWDEATVKSLLGNSFRLRAKPATEVYKDGALVEASRDSAGIIEFPTVKGQTYRVVH